MKPKESNFIRLHNIVLYQMIIISQLEPRLVGVAQCSINHFCGPEKNPSMKLFQLMVATFVLHHKFFKLNTSCCYLYINLNSLVAYMPVYSKHLVKLTELPNAWTVEIEIYAVLISISQQTHFDKMRH